LIFTLKKFLFSINFNLFLFFILMIGIQNSSEKAKINFLINESIDLPISFIIGSSFITGSLVGSIIPIKILLKK